MFNTFTNKLDERSLKAYKNIAGLFGIRGLNIAIGFIQVPLLLNYLDPERYGIWLTLTVFLGWFSLFNIGLGNGLRNKLAIAIAKGDTSKAKIYVSTTYAAIALIFSALFIVFLAVNQFLDWSVILNTSPELADELGTLALVIFFFFSARFVAALIEAIANAKQEPALANFINTSGRLVALAGIWLLILFAESRLLYLGFVLSGIPVFVTVAFSYFIFKYKYTSICPEFSFVRFNEFRSLVNLGLKFFFIQVASIVFYQSNNFIISHLFGPEQVTPYSIGYKYYSVVTLMFTIIVTPYWSAITDAYTKGELNWIKKTIRRLHYIWVAFLALLVGMFFASDYLIELWVGDEVSVSAGLSIALALYTMFFTYNSMYSSFINGVGTLTIEITRLIISTILYIPITIYFANIYGIKGIMYGLILITVAATIIYRIQYTKIINNRATGIWNK